LIKPTTPQLREYAERTLYSSDDHRQWSGFHADQIERHFTSITQHSHYSIKNATSALLHPRTLWWDEADCTPQASLFYRAVREDVPNMLEHHPSVRINAAGHLYFTPKDYWALWFEKTGIEPDPLTAYLEHPDPFIQHVAEDFVETLNGNQTGLLGHLAQKERHSSERTMRRKLTGVVCRKTALGWLSSKQCS